jgi:hypothetical protein
MKRIRLAAALALTSVVALGLSACTPTITPPPTSGSTSTSIAAPTATPTPTAVAPVQPASRFSVGCDDLFPAASLAPLFSHSLTEQTGAVNARQELDIQLSSTFYIQDLGGLSCAWSDGTQIEHGGQVAYLSILPITPAVWKHFDETAPVSAGATKYIFCSGGDQNSCEYEGDINGNWVSILLQGIVPTPSSNTAALPTAVHNLFVSAFAKVAAAGPAPTPPVGSVHLPTDPNHIITAAQVKSALGVGGKVGLDCDGESDGPWTIGAQAQRDVTNHDGCFFTAGNTGGGYGFMYWLPGGQWAEQQAQAATPSETAVTVPGLPAGDSAAEFKDFENDLTLDLVIGGNWVELQVDPKDPSIPQSSIKRTAAILTLAADVEKTVRG